MATGVRGSAFSFGENSVFYSAVDFGARITKTDVQNDAAIASALTSIATAGGGVLLIPHGVANTFDPATDFPVTANALMVWTLTGNSFLLHSNQEIDADVGDEFAAAFFTDPSAISYKYVDANPPTYTYSCEVYDDSDTPVITGSSFDLCWFLPGGIAPVMALARNGAKLGALHLFNGLYVSDAAQFVDAVQLEGAVQYEKQIVVPVTAESTQIADTTRFVSLNHTATIATHTLTLPQAPVDGQVVDIFSRSIITTLTLAAGTGESIETGHTITTLGALGSVAYVYDSGTTKWYRVR